MTFRQAKYPAGWNIKTLGSASEVVNGGTPKTGVSEYWNGKYLWITPAEMGKRQSPYVENTERKLSNAGLNNSSAQLLPPNSVILSSRAPIGHLVINTKPMATNQGCKGLIPSSILHYKFLYYYLYHNVDLMNSLGTGATFKELSGGKLKEIPIPVPPLSEQKRIVGILDKAFAAISTAKANAEKNLQNARELFESYLQGVFANPGDGWEEKKLGEIAKVIGGFSFKSTDFEKQGRYQVIRMGNVRPGIIRPKERPVFIDNVDNNVLKRALLLPNDVIITQTGTKKKRDYGFTAIIDKKNYLLNQRISAIRFSKNFLPKFFLYFSWTIFLKTNTLQTKQEP